LGPNSAEGPKNGKGPPMGSERAPRWVGDAREALGPPPISGARGWEKPNMAERPTMRGMGPSKAPREDATNGVGR